MKKTHERYLSDGLNHGRVLVNTTPILIVGAAPVLRRSVLIQNLSENDVYLGGAAVTASNGVKLNPGATIEVFTLAAIWAVATVAASDIRYFEEA